MGDHCGRRHEMKHCSTSLMPLLHAAAEDASLLAQLSPLVNVRQILGFSKLMTTETFCGAELKAEKALKRRTRGRIK